MSRGQLDEELTENVINIIASLMMTCSTNRRPRTPRNNYSDVADDNILDLLMSESARGVETGNAFLPPTPMNTPIMMPHRNPERDIFERSFETKPKYKKVISKDGEKCLKTYTYNPEEHDQKTCPITQSDFEEGDNITQLPCTHIFEQEAIEHWLKKEKAECPVCRLKLAHIEVPQEHIEVPQEHIEVSEEETDDIDPHMFSRLRLFDSLSRIARTSLISYNNTYDQSHPFGPRNEPESRILRWLSPSLDN